MDKPASPRLFWKITWAIWKLSCAYAIFFLAEKSVQKLDAFGAK